MVARLIFGLIILPLYIFAGEFTAAVNRNQVHMGEHFTLHLILKEATAQGVPSLEPLKTGFHISSQQQSSNVVYRNGQGSSSVTWKVSLAPKKEGEIIIPSIPISTNKGVFSTSPIRINVLPKSTESPPEQEITVAAHVDKKTPFKNEPIHYTVRLLSKANVENLNVQKLSMENAIIEQNGEAEIKEAVVNGVKTHSIEFKYLITPLKEGTLTIPSLLIQGGILVSNRAQKSSFFDDDFEPFFSMSRFGRLKPFTLTTNEVSLEVQPPIAGITPWLPARAFKVEEIWDDSQRLQVGEPISRSLIITAEGLMASQLPHLGEMQNKDSSFNMYADKPEVSEQIRGETIQSSRKEHYTLIPQQAGLLTLPEISIAWWDINTHQKLYANIPARSIQVLPAPESNQVEAATLNEALPLFSADDIGQARDPLLYVAFGGLGLLFCGALLWGISLQKKIARLTEKPTKKEPIIPPKIVEKENLVPLKKENLSSKNKQEKLPDLNPT